eukprot:TRINITY_DN108233_c0_g1_i1.p1 TRINITY_DN108233_c0_g1~~TRINITY_DN108233_c0_g1_i1.p1  ORF type:complete len:2373 (-),score=512.75 TRINITY_DN108233_c0_g1_i1:255-7373(-)
MAALLRELQLPRLTWAEVLLDHVFPWANTPSVEPGARQGLMLAVVRRWREMELAGHDKCVEALQRVPFISTVGGKMLSPASLLDPRVEELQRLYAVNSDGPFPAAEVFAVLLPLAQRGLLRFRQELSLEELNERILFLHGWSERQQQQRSASEQQGPAIDAAPDLSTTAAGTTSQVSSATAGEDTWEKVRTCAESLLQYVAVKVTAKCEDTRKAAEMLDKSEEKPPPPPPPPQTVSDKSRSSAFFLWPTSLRLPDLLTGASSGPSAGASSSPAHEETLAVHQSAQWSEDDVEKLKCKLHAYNWLPAAAAPREWLATVPWAGQAHRLWRPNDMLLMQEFWTCGAARPLLDLETQLGLPGERKHSVHKALMQLISLPEQPPAAERCEHAWTQLDVISHWWSSAVHTEETKGAASWVTNCLYRHVYPVLNSLVDVETLQDGAASSSLIATRLKAVFVEGDFVAIEDLSLEQGFSPVGLYQLPVELKTLAPDLCALVKSNFGAADMSRALRCLSQRLESESRQQLTPLEVEAAVRVSIAMSEQVRKHGDELPEVVLVPTKRGTLRSSHECIYNNMRWLSEEEQQKRSLVVTNIGLDWVHQSISNEVAQCLQVQGLSTQVAADALAATDAGDKDGAEQWFEAAGQAEPLTVRLRSLLQDIKDGASVGNLGVFKELVQNADDAKATEVHFVWDWRSFGKQSLMSPEMARWQGPCLWAHNDSSFSPQDFENITQLGAMQKMSKGSQTSRASQIGRFGLGFNSVYSFTDLPSILSDDVVLFLDPHVRHLRAMGASAAKPGIKLRFLKIDVLDKFQDQFEPYHGMFGCNLRASTPFKGTLIRLPFRTPEAAKASDISNAVATPSMAMEYLAAFREAAAQCLIFLQHVQKIEFFWIPPDAGSIGEPTPVLQVRIEQPQFRAELKLASDVAQAAAVQVSTDDEAFQYRRLFSSRTLPQSKERRSFIADLMDQIGFTSTTTEDEQSARRPFIAFNLVVAVRWAPLPGVRQQIGLEPGERIDAWRLFLQHDDPEDEFWTAAGTGEGDGRPDEVAQNDGFDFVPFAGLALCLSRPLKQDEPRICCFLPLPIQSSLPFLVNANFVLRDPTSPSRLDLATVSNRSAGSTTNSNWNSLLLRKIVEPMIRTLLEEQAAAIDSVQRRALSDAGKESSFCATWAASDPNGICSVMPSRKQLPPSLRELLDLPSLYQGLAKAKLFPPLVFGGGKAAQLSGPVAAESAIALAAQVLGTDLGGKANRLLAYVDSVQPLRPGDGTYAQRQAVHMYLHCSSSTSDGHGSFRFCDVVPQVETEFSDAGVERHTVINRSLLMGRLRDDQRTALDAASAAELLGYILSSDSSQVESLRGLPLAPLCDGKVGRFAPAGNQDSLYYAFPSSEDSSAAALAQVFAQSVLKHLVPKATLDFSKLEKESVALMGRSAHELGVVNINSCEQLAKAALVGLPSFRAPPVEQSASLFGQMLSTLGNSLRGGEGSRSITARSLGLGTDSEANLTLSALWSFAEAASDGLSDDFLSNFDCFYILPSWDPSRAADTQANAVETAASVLTLLPLSRNEPLLMPPEPGLIASSLAEVAAILLPDRFVDTTHPAMTDKVARFLASKGILHPFSQGALLTAIAAWASAPNQFSALVNRCNQLHPRQRHYLRSELASALSGINVAEDDVTKKKRAAAFCRLPLFLSEAAARAQSDSTQVFRAMAELAVVDGEPLDLASPPPRLDLETIFVFRSSRHTSPELADALNVQEVREHLAADQRFFEVKAWLYKQVAPHLADMTADDQVLVLERLLPLIEDIEEANSQPYLVPVDVEGGRFPTKPPALVLDPQDFTIQEVFGIVGEDWPALDRNQLFHFPARTLTTSVRQHLRRLGMRKSLGDGQCLLFLCDALRARRGEVTGDRYGEIQRGLLQRIVESWPNLDGAQQNELLAKAFVELSAEADGGEQPDSLFSLSPFRETSQCQGRLFSLSELVSRTDPRDPYLCWTSLPLCPRGFPDFPGFKKPGIEDVVRHARVIGELADGTNVSFHQWEELKERVVTPICQFLESHELFRDALAAARTAVPPPEAHDGDVPVQAEVQVRRASEPSSLLPEADDVSRARTRVCSQLRRVKFLAVPLDSSTTCPHTLVAPWRISLVLKEHRLPMFALPAYLQEHVPLLRLLGVRDALELPQGETAAMAGEGNAAQAAEQAMKWLFENGAESFADVTVRCDGGNLFLHRNILMARSDYFRAMFQGASSGGGFREGLEDGAEVHLYEAPIDVAKVLFGYLYHGKVDEAPLEGPEGTSNSVELLCLSDQMGVPHLFEFAQLWVANQQDLEDCADMLKLASRHRAELLERATLALMAANLDSPEVEQQLQQLSEEHRRAIEDLANRPRRSLN